MGDTWRGNNELPLPYQMADAGDIISMGVGIRDTILRTYRKIPCIPKVPEVPGTPALIPPNTRHLHIYTSTDLHNPGGFMTTITPATTTSSAGPVTLSGDQPRISQEPR